MTTVVSILFSDIIPLRERGTWQGYMNIVWAFGASMGAPLGGILADSIGWRWYAPLAHSYGRANICRAFIGQFPVTLIACATVYFVLELPEVGDAHWITKLKRIDFLGAFTLIAAVFCLLVGLDRGSNVAWKDSYTLIFCLTSIPLFAIFIWVEMKVASHPFAPGHIIFQHSLLASYLCNFFVLGAYMGIMFYVPLYFQAVDGMTATAAGSRLIPVMICSVSGSLFGGQVMQRTGRYYWLTVYSMIICILGGIVIFVCSSTFASSSWGITIGLGMLAFGGGSSKCRNFHYITQIY
jgi:MFS family permease